MKNRYKVLRRHVNVHGVFRPGQVVELREKDARPLLDTGLVEPYREAPARRAASKPEADDG